MAGLLRELRQAARALGRRPGFIVTAVLTLALGIGTTAAVFTLVDSVLIEPLPYPGSDRLVSVRHAAPGLGLPAAGHSEETYLHYGRHNRVLQEMGLYFENTVTLTDADAPERVRVALTTHTLFSVLKARPALGRLFREGDGQDGSPPVLISHDLWTRRYGSDPAIIGRTVEVHGVRRVVIGVLAPDFDFPRPETDVWYPVTATAGPAALSDLSRSVVARLAPGVSVADAEADLNRVVPMLADVYPDVTPALLDEAALRVVVRPLKDTVVGDAGTALWPLFGGMAVLLLIAGVNVANLFIVRAESRRKEIAVRAALGAARADLARHFLGESVPLAALGAAAGLGLAYLGVETLVAFGPGDLPRLHEVAVDGRVAAFAAALAVATGLLLGLVALAYHGRRHRVGPLRVDGRAATPVPRHRSIRRVLVASQVALALTLLVGSALMTQSVWRLRGVDAGFDPERVLTIDLAMWYRAAPGYENAAPFWDRLLERVRALPGVEAAGAANALPLADLPATYDDPIETDADRPGATGARPTATVSFVTAGYFEAMRIPVVEGRVPWADEPADVPRPVLASAALARRLFPNGTAVGRRVRQAGRAGEWSTIVGVAGDVPRRHVAGEQARVLYAPVLDRPAYPGRVPRRMTLVVRATVPPTSLVPAIRRIVRDLRPDLPLVDVRTMDRVVADSMARTSFTMALLVVAAAAALFLGAVGLYGVVSYAVGRRVREIGLRMALGAPTTEIRRTVVGDGATVAAAGVAAGVPAALLVSRLLDNLLFGVSAADPPTIAAMAALLFGVAVLASDLPARRATKLDPSAALRAD